MEHTLAAAGRWACSSKRNPCPLCGRNVDGKCRRKEGIILCFYGTRFAPPASLQQGDVISLEGRDWRVWEQDAGASGNSLKLKPNLTREDFKPAVRQARRRQASRLTPALQTLFRAVRRWVQAALAVPEFQHCTWPEFQEARQTVTTALQFVERLQGALVQARREAPELGTLLASVNHWRDQVTYQHRDVERFARWALGEPTPQQLARLQQVAQLQEVAR
jgi:hypothetical protein